MPAIGLDVGSSSIKLISLSGNRKKPKLEAFGLAVNPVGNLITENQNEQIKIAESIKKLFTDAQIKERKAVAALSEARVFTRVVDIPILSDAELASAIGWEAEQYIPVPISDVQLDYRVLAKPEVPTTGAKMKVFLVAAPKIAVDSFVHILEMAGVEPISLETEILGLSRSLGTDANSTILVVNLGASSTDLCVIENGVILITRAMPSGGGAMSRALATELGLEIAQAEQYKRSYGLNENQLQGKVKKALLPVFNSVVGEIRKIIHFYSTKRKGKFSRIVLSGGGAYLPEISTDLARELGVEVVLGNPFAGVEMKEDQRKKVAPITAVFSVAVGLARREL